MKIFETIMVALAIFGTLVWVNSYLFRDRGVNRFIPNTYYIFILSVVYTALYIMFLMR